MRTTSVIGREEELGAIQAFLAGVEQGPSALVLSGEPGIGKTILWEKGIEEAGRTFVRVLTCRGVEAEASLSFAGLSELISPVLEETAPSLVTPRRRALEIALRLVEPGDDAPDNLVIGLAVFDVLRLLAERGPVLVGLDDAQWLDASTAGVLQIAFRRLHEPVGVLAPAVGRVPAEITEPVTAMLWGITTERLQQWLSVDGGGTGVLTGLAGSPGVAEGRARVILHVDQLGEIEDGEILVAPTTATGWTPVFCKIAAAVLDMGGIISHAAIVAREYGLPAVVGTGIGTRRIKAGDRVRVDADAGTVTILG